MSYAGNVAGKCAPDTILVYIKNQVIYSRQSFGFLTMYGRQRVGKTTILLEFAQKHKAIFYSAQEKNDALNLEDLL